MPALIETTLARPVSATDQQIPLASATGIRRGDLLHVDGETMRAVATPVQTTVRVMRGVGGPAVPHRNGLPVYAGRAHQFHTTDPVGLAPAAPDDNVWVNTVLGRVWRAQGDAAGPGRLARYWELVVTTNPIGALGIRTGPVSTPSS